MEGYSSKSENMHIIFYPHEESAPPEPQLQQRVRKYVGEFQQIRNVVQDCGKLILRGCYHVSCEW